MPTYEYECTKCGHRFELFQKIGDSPRKRCPSCHSAVRRLISGGCGLIFKGSGFYITDYKRKDAKETRKTDRKDSGNGKPSASGNTDNKKND